MKNINAIEILTDKMVNKLQKNVQSKYINISDKDEKNKHLS